MIFLILAILCSSLISIIMRISSDKVKGKLSMLSANYAVCSLCGAIYTGFDIMPVNNDIEKVLGFGLINGVLYLVSFLLLQLNTAKHGIVLSSIFMKLGLLVPIVLSVLFFNEIPSAIQIAGFIIAIISIILINLRNGSSIKNFGISLILLLLFGGCADAMSKVYEYYGSESLTNQFLFFTFATSFILCLTLVILKKEKTEIKDVIFGALIGIPNFFSSKFLISALTTIPAVVTYPTFSVATILLVTLVGVMAFKEKLTKIQWFALCLIIISLIFLNI